LNFSGKYIGTLWYGEGYGEGIIGTELTFQMEIEETDDVFVGVSVDLEGSGKSPDEASVQGIIGESMISFDKVYKSYHYDDEQGNLVVDRTQEGFPIEYNGLFNEKTGHYEGTWRMIALRKYWFFSTKQVCLGKGTFQLKRV